MKKLMFIPGVLSINIVLIYIIYSRFNPNYLNLSELSYYNGFSLEQLVPNAGLQSILFFASLFGLVFINALFVNVIKVNRSSLK